MKKKVIAGLIIAMSVSQYALANHDNYNLERRIIDVSSQLYQLAEENSTDPCSGDVLIAGAYVESAGHELDLQKRDKALRSMIYGHKELKEISNTRAYCAHLAPRVKPILAKVILLESELENLTCLTGDEQKR